MVVELHDEKWQHGEVTPKYAAGACQGHSKTLPNLDTSCGKSFYKVLRVEQELLWCCHWSSLSRRTNEFAHCITISQLHNNHKSHE
jgi:hypothetical protein